MSPIRQELLRRRSLRRGNSQGPVFPPSPITPQVSHVSPAPGISPAARNFIPIKPDYGTPLRRRKALIIGIGYSRHKELTTLPGSRNDVIVMFRLLTSQWFQFPQSSVRVLCDELVSIGNNVQSQMPTRRNIVESLNWLTGDLVAGDSVVFFFSGHGKTVVDISGDEVDTGFDQVSLSINKKGNDNIYRIRMLT